MTHALEIHVYVTRIDGEETTFISQHPELGKIGSDAEMIGLVLQYFGFEKFVTDKHPGTPMPVYVKEYEE